MFFSLLLVSFSFLCYKGLYNDKIWKIIGNRTIILSIGIWIIHIMASYNSQSNGPLSSITCGINNILGNSARIFPTLKQTKGLIISEGFIINFILNLIIFLQIIY